MDESRSRDESQFEPGLQSVDPSAEIRQVYIVYKTIHLRYAFTVNVDCGRDNTGRLIVNKDSIVTGSITEQGNNTPFMGSAPLNLGSIAPKDDGTIDVSGYVNWDSPLTCWISLIIFQYP
jgi:hypothetical protein